MFEILKINENNLTIEKRLYQIYGNSEIVIKTTEGKWYRRLIKNCGELPWKEIVIKDLIEDGPETMDEVVELYYSKMSDVEIKDTVGVWYSPH